MKQNDEYIQVSYAGNFFSVQDLPASIEEIAITGRSNSGKSSFIRSISNQKKNIKVSSRPGSTRKLHLYQTQTFSIVDLPGYGYAKVSRSRRDMLSEMIAGYLNNRNVLKYLYVTMDIRRDLREEEIYLSEITNEKKIPLIMILTKTDKINQKEFSRRKKYFESIQSELGISNLFYVSNLTGKGFSDVLRFLLTSGS